MRILSASIRFFAALIQIGNEISASAYNADGRTSKELLDEAERKVFTIAEQGAGNREGFAAINDLLGKAVQRVEEMYKSGEAITGISSGFSNFDEKTSGLQKSDLIIIAGRPSMGKNQFCHESRGKCGNGNRTFSRCF